MGLLNTIKNFFRTPSSAYINRRFSMFSFFNKDLATNETIFAAVSMLSNAVASAPISISQYYTKLKPTEHQLARLFEYGPNSRTSTFQFIRLLETLRNTKGAGYAIKEYGYNGEISAMWVLDTDYVTPIIESESSELYYEIRSNGNVRYVHNSHIIVVTHLTTDGYTVINPINVLRNTIDYDREIKEFSLNQMKSTIKANIVVKLQTKLSPENQKIYEDMLKDFKESGVLFIDAGKELQELKNSSFIDPNVAAVEQITVERVERVYNMPGKLTGKATNVEDLLYLKDTILPIIRMYEQEFTRKCLIEPERDEGIRVKLSLNGFARADMKTRGEFYFKGIRSSWFSANDIRALEDMAPIKGGEVYYVSKDLIPINMLGIQNTNDNSNNFSGKS